MFTLINVIIYVKIIQVVIFRTIEGENKSKYWIFWEVAVHGLGYEATEWSMVVTLQMKNNISGFKALWTTNKQDSVTVRYGGGGMKTSKSGIWEKPTVNT